VNVAFVACPIGPPNSPVRVRSDKLLRHVITPTCRDLDIEVVRADKLRKPGRITEQVTEKLGSAFVLLADVTGLNPNVMFELGFRAGVKRPYILLARKGQRLPFDLQDSRTIFYSLDLEGAAAASSELKEQIQHIEELPPVVAGGGAEDRGADHSPTSDSRDLLLAAQAVENYLQRLKQTKGKTRVGFDGVRKHINPDYTNDFLGRVLHHFPGRFRMARLKGDKPGIALSER